MGILERREREKVERKALIMRCAKELILEYGAEKVSMMDIAKKAELSKATLYLYFPSKALLFMEICNIAGIEFLEFFRSRMRPGLSAIETIKLYWNTYLEMYGESDEMVIIFSMWQYLVPNYPFLSLEEQTKPLTIFEFYTAIQDMIAQGIAEKTFEADTDPAMIARTLLSLFSVVIENAAKMPKGSRKVQFMEELTKIFQTILRGIAREDLDRSLLALPVPAEKKQKNKLRN
ncbi:MAG: TetR/AcrR family transcriptional regulator; helix-turn-helix transcriptional regulator [Treponema sp.]|jgi:AcrR family transcriptional regulator|nr:TetR/AcrR family transcriptional regulator; helix-turn-helix transcriptional regulator [Treponema sp.]